MSSYDVKRTPSWNGATEVLSVLGGHIARTC